MAQGVNMWRWWLKQKFFIAPGEAWYYTQESHTDVFKKCKQIQRSHPERVLRQEAWADGTSCVINSGHVASTPKGFLLIDSDGWFVRLLDDIQTFFFVYENCLHDKNTPRYADKNRSQILSGHTKGSKTEKLVHLINRESWLGFFLSAPLEVYFCLQYLSFTRVLFFTLAVQDLRAHI